MIRSEEKEIVGGWQFVKGKTVADSNCDRINQLTTQYLIERKKSASGWETLYVNPVDNRFWELSFPNSEWHGGGPQRLTNISEKEARDRFGDF